MRSRRFPFGQEQSEAGVSPRAHHERAGDTFSLRPLPGNTGTQVNAEMLSGPEDVPLAPGTRIILGGVVRLKFEIA